MRRITFTWFSSLYNPFKRQPHKMVKHTERIRWLLPTNCLSVLDHFVRLPLKGLKKTVLQLKLGLYLSLSWLFNWLWLWLIIYDYLIQGNVTFTYVLRQNHHFSVVHEMKIVYHCIRVADTFHRESLLSFQMRLWHIHTNEQ